MRTGPDAITSAANPRIWAALALRERRNRDRTGHLLVDGAREVGGALDAGLLVVEAFVAVGGAGDEAGTALLERLIAAGAALMPVTGAARTRLAYGERGSDIVAVVAAPPTDLDRVAEIVSARPDPLVVVIEDAEKPGNLGAIARSADGAGATALVAAVGHGPAPDPWNANAVRASMGTIFGLPLAVAPTDAVLAWLRAARIRIVAARVQASAGYGGLDLRGPLAIALGSEANGLGSGWQAPDIVGARIPMLGRGDSLNVSAAAAILLYEARRQREANPAEHHG